MTTKETVYLAWDVEAGGPKFKHPTIAVGCCYGTITSYKKIKWYIKFDEKTFDERCYNEFWVNNLDLLQSIKKNAKEPKDAWNEIKDFLTDVEKQYDRTQYKIKIVSDDSNDISKIDYGLEHYTDRKGLHYYDDVSYRGVSDPSEQKKFFLSY